MTKEAALYQFWSGFGLNAYEENTVPTGKDAPNMPYITYQVVMASFGYSVQAAASLWYRSESWTEINQKSHEISAAIGYGGVRVPYDGGAIWIRRGTPFAQNMGDSNDKLVRRKYLNVTLEYFSVN